ncbi:MAG: hypothetical protein D6770_08470 [Anaerolineae bacterium]|nr:MAG: hypothetical protein D6770_08470 [Anaerolineae bacterium]
MGATAVSRKRLWKQKVAGILLTFWLLAISVSFFVFSGRLDLVHDAVLNAEAITRLAETAQRLDPARFFLDIVRSGVLSFLIVLAFAGWGLLIKRLAEGEETANDLPALITACLLAEGVFIFFLMSWLQFQPLRPAVTLTVLIPGFIAFLVTLYRQRWSIPSPLPSPGRWDKVLIALILFLLLVSSAYTSARLSYDASLLYFLQPKWMAGQGQIVLLSANDAFSVAHLYIGVLYAAIIQIAGDQAARFFVWWHAVATLIVLLALARKAGLSIRAQILTATLALTSTAILDAFGDGKYDLITTSFILSALYRTVSRHHSPPRPGYYWLNGFLLGASIISRPYNLFLVPPFFLAFYGVLILQKRLTLTRALDDMLWMLLAALLVGAHFLLWNRFLLGDALAPLHLSASLNASTWKVPAQRPSLTAYRIFYPFLVTFGHAPQSGGHITPLALAFAPFLISMKARRALRESPLVRELSIAAILTLALWLVFSFAIAEIRYVYFLWYLLFLPIATAIEEATHSGNPFVRAWVKTLPPLLLLFMIGRAGVVALVTYSPVQTDGQARCDHLPYCQAMNVLNETAPPGARVLIYSPYRYYLRNDLLQCASYRQDYLLVERKGRQSDASFWEEAYRRGFRYVLIDAFTMFYEARGYLVDDSHHPLWLDVQKVFEIPEQQLALYRLQGDGAPTSPEVRCEPVPGGWDIIEAHPEVEQGSDR